MCPGGYVVNASSEPGRLAVNGMSYSGRDGKNANSAIIVAVTPADYGSDHPLAGIDWNRELINYAMGNCRYSGTEISGRKSPESILRKRTEYKEVARKHWNHSVKVLMNGRILPEFFRQSVTGLSWRGWTALTDRSTALPLRERS